MSPFKEQIAADNAAIFINELEFAGEHNLNGSVCKAILQDISVAEAGFNEPSAPTSIAYSGVYGSRVQVNCLKDDLPEVPVSGNGFSVDDKLFFVESCADDMGILTIQLVANDR